MKQQLSPLQELEEEPCKKCPYGDSPVCRKTDNTINKDECNELAWYQQALSDVKKSLHTRIDLFNTRIEEIGLQHNKQRFIYKRDEIKFILGENQECDHTWVWNNEKHNYYCRECLACEVKEEEEEESNNDQTKKT